MDEAILLYCMVERGEESFLFAGLGGAKLETISYGEIAAVVSPLSAASFDLLDQEAAKESVLKHQEVNSRLFQSRTVIPVRFGTVADSSPQVRELLQKVYLQVKAALKRLEGKTELVVRASWDLQVALEEVKGEIAIPTPATIGIEEKIAIGRQAFELIEARKRAITEAIHKVLYPLAADFCFDKPGGKEMVFDCSYLVEKGKEALFDEAVNRLVTEWEGRLNFKYIGPLVPYSFTRLEISQENFEVVDEARKALGLPETSSLEEIKACYRRLSLARHPDRSPDDPSAEEGFRNIVRAYEILRAYCENNRWMEEGRIYSFTREDVEKAVMVRGAA